METQFPFFDKKRDERYLFMLYSEISTKEQWFNESWWRSAVSLCISFKIKLNLFDSSLIYGLSNFIATQSTFSLKFDQNLANLEMTDNPRAPFEADRKVMEGFLS
jgi:hypothetical protein